jgi:hypothetical protein
MKVNDYYGLPVTSLTNPYLRLDFLADRGPRLVRLLLNGSKENILGETPGVRWGTPYGDYVVYGGHRLWHAPEVYPSTYVPEESPIVIDELADGLRLYRPPEEATGISKTIEVHLLPEKPVVMLDHILKNECGLPLELAAWAITQLPLGGTVILPQATKPLDSNGLQPNRSLALWPYSHWQDERMVLADDLVLVRAWAKMPPLKVGLMNRSGWSAYLRNRVLLVKQFQPQPDLPHPDFGSNVECYVDDKAIELETLGPLTQLAPGESAKLRETWELHRLPEAEETLEGARKMIERLRLRDQEKRG